MEDIIVRNNSMLSAGEEYIKLSGATLTVAHNKQTSTIPVSNIVSFTIKYPGAFTNGTITIALAGTSGSGVLYHGLLFGGSNNIVFVYNRDEVRKAEAMKKRIAELQASPPPEASSPSDADELRKFKALLDDGIITAAEFEAKKKQILGI